jgi:hypothetical protein
VLQIGCGAVEMQERAMPQCGIDFIELGYHKRPEQKSDWFIIYCVLEANSTSLSAHVGRSFSSDVRAEARTHMKYGARQLSCEDALQVGSARENILQRLIWTSVGHDQTIAGTVRSGK